MSSTLDIHMPWTTFFVQQTKIGREDQTKVVIMWNVVDIHLPGTRSLSIKEIVEVKGGNKQHRMKEMDKDVLQCSRSSHWLTLRTRSTCVLTVCLWQPKVCLYSSARDKYDRLRVSHFAMLEDMRQVARFHSRMRSLEGFKVSLTAPFVYSAIRVSVNPRIRNRRMARQHDDIYSRATMAGHRGVVCW